MQRRSAVRSAMARRGVAKQRRSTECMAMEERSRTTQRHSYDERGRGRDVLRLATAKGEINMTEADLEIQSLRRELECEKEINNLLTKELALRNSEIEKLKTQVFLQRDEIVKYRRMVGAYEEGRNV